VSEPSLPQTVTLLHRGVRRGAELLALLGEGRPVKVINSTAELAKDGSPADVVVVDVPAQERRVACEQVRRYHRGSLVVLLDRGDSGNDLPPDRSRTLLTRPFSLRQLSLALAAPIPTQPPFDPVSQPRLLMGQGIQDPNERPNLGEGASMVVPAVPRPARRWRERRVVRVSAISIMAALLFMGAFALVNQSDPCGPGCDELTGAGLTSPSSGTVGAVGGGPYTSDPRLGSVGPTTTEPIVGRQADDRSSSDGATNSGARISTTSAWSSGPPALTSSKDPSRPRPSAPSTTAPTTTKPRASTTTATTTTTTTTTAPTATTDS
jgi:hypothetical protein